MRGFRRKLIVLLMCILVSTQLSGCVINDMIQNMENLASGLQSDSFKNTVANDNKFAMSVDTKNKQSKALDLQDRANFWDELSAKHTGAWDPIGMWADMWANKRAMDASRAIDKYESAKVSDKAFIMSKGQAGDSNFLTTKWRRFTPLICLVAFLLLMIIFKLLANAKRKSKAELIAAKRGVAQAPATPVIIQQPAPQQAVLVDRNNDKSIVQCKKYCKKFDIDYDQMLAQYGGDPQKLLDVLVVSRKEDFH